MSGRRELLATKQETRDAVTHGHLERSLAGGPYYLLMLPATDGSTAMRVVYKVGGYLYRLTADDWQEYDNLREF